MQLTEAHRDALCELINIGYGRAAASLSRLTRRRIQLEAPQISFQEIDRAVGTLRSLLGGEIASVHQIFSGSISGQAMLLLDRQAALALNSLLLGEERGDLREAEREMLTEVGNILLNACLGIFGNVLQVQMTFSVPRFHLDCVEDILRSATVREQDLQYALVVRTRFTVSASNVVGYMVIVLGVTSLARLRDELDKRESSQLNA